jgi:mRNA interferase MazF
VQTGLRMRRGEMWLVDLDPVRGNEATKRRPAIVVSNDSANAVAARLGRGVVTVVPVTSNVSRVFPFQVLLSAGTAGLDVDSKAQAEQVRSVSVERLGSALGRVPAPVMVEVDEALRLHLGL